MADRTHRQISLDRLDEGVYLARNERGGQLRFGSRAGDAFTPVELLLAAIAGCSAVDIDIVTGRRATPSTFSALAEAESVRDDTGNLLDGIEVSFRVRFPPGADGDAARAVLPWAQRISRDRTCTVSRTVAAGVPVAFRIAGEEVAGEDARADG
ncbi:MAG: OsmC family protein [Kineosporiaceae bacterium]